MVQYNMRQNREITMQYSFKFNNRNTFIFNFCQVQTTPNGVINFKENAYRLYC